MATITNRQDFKSYCLNNKYSNWYFSIIDNAVSRNWNKKTAPVYVEKHHIVPKSILKNEITVCLTAREHFICHLLLPKMLEGKNKEKMLYALIGMKRKSKATKDRYINSKLYSFAKKQYGDYLKKLWKTNDYREHMIKKITETHADVSGKNNPMYGKTGELSPHFGKQKSEDHKNKIKNALTGISYSENRKKNMSLNSPKNSLGKKWYHHTITKQQKYFFEGQQPNGFVLGRG